MTRLSLTDLNPDGYNQGLHHYPFIIRIDRRDEICNTADDPSGRILPDKTKMTSTY